MAEECRIAEEKAAEERRIAEERAAEERRIAEERAAKKRKKIFAVVSAAAAACFAVFLLITKVVIPNSKYNKAVELIDKGEYERAYMLLSGLTYKDSNKILDSINEQFQQIMLGNAAVGDTAFFGSYEQDNNMSNGKEDVEWIVLAKENGKVLVISKYALDCKRFNSHTPDVTWEKSSLRTWLNEIFLNDTFSAKEQEKIATTNVSADRNPDYNTNPGNVTNDKVFLLSITEAEKYFVTDEPRKCVPTPYAKAQGVFMSNSDKTTSGKANCRWWLRSCGRDHQYAAYVGIDGSVYSYGDVVYSANVYYVRPAMWIMLDS